MIRYLIILLTFFVCTSASAQDTICIPSYKLIELAKRVESNKLTINSQTKIIENLKSQIVTYDSIILKSDQILKKKEEEIAIYKEALNINPTPSKNIKWYKTSTATYFFGILTGGSLLYISSKVFIK